MMPSSSTGDPRWDRLIHLVAGELPADEAATLRAWVNVDPERQRALAELEEIWRATDAPVDVRPEAWDAEAELRRVRREVEETGRVIARVGPSFKLNEIAGRRSRMDHFFRIAAAAVLVVGGGLLWRTRSPQSPGVSLAERMTTDYRTASGERLSFGLPDGTRVILAPGSSLRRSATYGTRDRNVYLEGQAYFYVTHDSARPFAVHTAHAVARDLGTRFVVRAYADEAPTDVVVSEGLVAVTRAALQPSDSRVVGDSVLVRPKQRARIMADGTVTFSSSVALAPYFDWTMGQLVFQGTPLADVVRQLRRWYGVDIALPGAELRDSRLTATLAEENAAEALDLVATSLKLSVTRVGQTYVFARVGH